MVAATQDPELTDDEIWSLLEQNQAVAQYPVWEPNTAYAVGQRVTPKPRNGLTYVVVTSGTSGVTQPAFPNLEDGTVVDGTVTWEVSTEEVSYNLRKAAADGWLIKAGKVTNRVDMKTEVHSLSRSQMYKMCMDQRKAYLRGSPGSIPVTSQAATQAFPVIGNVNPAP